MKNLRLVSRLILIALFVLCTLTSQVQSASADPISLRGAESSAVQPTAVAQGPQKIIVILIEFPDKAHHVSVEKIRERVFTEMNDYYQEVSYGMVSIVGDITEKWYTVQSSLTKLDLERWNYDTDDMDDFRRESIKTVDPDVDFGDYEYVYIVAAGDVWGNACIACTVPNHERSKLNVVVLNEDYKMGTYAHELGHLLPSSHKERDNVGLPDLYDYNDLESERYVGRWDIMCFSSSPKHFSAWSKITLGWIAPETVTLNPEKVVPVDLRPLEESSGPRALVIRLTSMTSYVIEVRRKIGFDINLPSEGVLLYFVDLNRGSGHGVVRLIDSHPGTETLDDAPYREGAQFEDTKNKVYVAVAYTDGVGFTVIAAGSKVEEVKDTDGDGLLDYVEARFGTNPNIPDSDSDGLNDGDEVYRYDTDPLKVDTDGDGLNDGVEVLQHRTDPLKFDTDGDGLSDGEEVLTHETDPLKKDTDDDGVYDGNEIELGTNPRVSDTDGDGLKDGREFSLGTDPLNPDSDQDQLPDGVEVNTWATNPLNPDSDGDGLSDGREIELGSDPLKSDTDNDYWPDGADLMPTNQFVPNVIVAVLVATIVIFAVLFVVRRPRAKKTTPHPAVPSASSMILCRQCGAKIRSDSAFCEECGQKLVT